MPASRRNDTSNQTWMDDASCAQIAPDDWFPEKGELSKEVRRICAACPVRLQCLEYALRNEEQFGIWGGHSAVELRKLRKVRISA